MKDTANFQTAKNPNIGERPLLEEITLQPIGQPRQLAFFHFGVFWQEYGGLRSTISL